MSVRPSGATEYGTRCEIKNLNSFRFMERAIEYEVRRQIELIEDGGRVVQETRLYDPDRDETRSMRSKEDAHDYRYFPDPDLPALVVTDALLERVRASLPELPAAMRERFQRELGLSAYDAVTLTGDRDTARFFEQTVAALARPGRSRPRPRPTGSWSTWPRSSTARACRSATAAFAPRQLAGLIARIADGTVSGKIARDVFQAIWDERRSEPTPPTASSRSSGLKQISDTGALETIVDEVLAANPKSVEEFRAGKEKALNALVGQAMKASQGKANPQQLTELLRRRLATGG